MKTYFARNETVQRDWYVIDATDQVLGRLAVRVAKYLRGKHKPEYTPHTDVGDYIIILNADKIRVTGNKEQDKIYYRHSGYPGGIKQTRFYEMQERAPGRAIEIAVKGMLPKNRLGRAMFCKLKVYASTEHPHTAQQPKQIQFEEMR